MSARAIDVHALPTMLTALRLPSFHRHWHALAERADKEGWPAARFLAALAEIELAERDTRRIRRHLLEANLPAGKTLATFDVKVIPSIPRARIEALAAGDWLETGANLIAIGNSGAGKTHLLSAIAHALVEAGRRVLYSRTTDLVQKLQAARPISCNIFRIQPAMLRVRGRRRRRVHPMLTSQGKVRSIQPATLVSSPVAMATPAATIIAPLTKRST